MSASQAGRRRFESGRPLLANLPTPLWQWRSIKKQTGDGETKSWHPLRIVTTAEDLHESDSRKRLRNDAQRLRQQHVRCGGSGGVLWSFCETAACADRIGCRLGVGHRLRFHSHRTFLLGTRSPWVRRLSVCQSLEGTEFCEACPRNLPRLRCPAGISDRRQLESAASSDLQRLPTQPGSRVQH